MSPRPRGMADTEDAEQEIRKALDVVQSMIDISADRLEGLRTQCSTSAELTQQEIRTLEVTTTASLYLCTLLFTYSPALFARSNLHYDDSGYSTANKALECPRQFCMRALSLSFT